MDLEEFAKNGIGGDPDWEENEGVQSYWTAAGFQSDSYSGSIIPDHDNPYQKVKRKKRTVSHFQENLEEVKNLEIEERTTKLGTEVRGGGGWVKKTRWVCPIGPRRKKVEAPAGSSFEEAKEFFQWENSFYVEEAQEELEEAQEELEELEEALEAYQEKWEGR